MVRVPGRDAVQEHLRREGMASAVHCPVPLHRTQPLMERRIGAKTFPVSEPAGKETLALPLFADMSPSTVELVASVVSDAVEMYRNKRAGWISVRMNRLLAFARLGVAGLSVVALVVLVTTLVLGSGRGLDITDESSYLLWAQAPDSFLVGISQYGHYTGLLYGVTGTVRGFRLVGIVGLLIVAAVFGLSVDATIERLTAGARPRSERLACTTALVAASMVYYSPWLLTPSYNWLNLVSSLLFFTAILGITNFGSCASVQGFDPRLVIACLAAGLALALVALAKPSTVLLLAPVAPAALLVFVPSKRRLLPLTAWGGSASGFLFLHVVFFESGFREFVEGMLRDQVLLGLAGSGHTVSALVHEATLALKQLPGTFVRTVPQWWVLCLVIPIFGLRAEDRLRTRLYDIAVATAVLSIWGSLLVTGTWWGGQTHVTRIGTGMTWLLLGTLAAIGVSAAVERFQSRDLMPLSRSAVASVGYATMLWFGALAFGFGSNAGILRRASFGFVLLAGASLFLASVPSRSRSAGLTSLITVAVIVATSLLAIKGGWGRPYRLMGSVSEQTEPTQVTPDGSMLSLDPRTRAYVEGLRRIAARGGWHQGTALIDLTGGTPGAALVLGASSPVVPWLVGGYPGSNARAKRILEFIGPAVRRKAWILRAPEGRRKISDDVLQDLGFSFPQRYRLLGRVRTGHRDELQELWEPRMREGEANGPEGVVGDAMSPSLHLRLRIDDSERCDCGLVGVSEP